MEEAFESLTARKIHELLVLCGIGGCNDEPIKEHILAISNFIRDQWLRLGRTDAPPRLTPRRSPTPATAANEFSTSDTRCRPDYIGPESTKKKRRCNNKAKGGADNNVQKEKDTVATQESGTPVPRPSMTEEPAVIGPYLQLESPLSVLFSEGLYLNQPGAATDTPTPRMKTVVKRVPGSILENILINCVRLNDALGRYGQRSAQTTVTTSVKAIQSFVDEIVQLDYPDAIQAIKQENAISASKNVQTRYNETAYWEIIKKGADLLDQKSLPTPKGPLDEFTVAEKVATERFMREAGYGLSLANQRQCRLFWRRLFEMRQAGVDKILLYRTKEFDRFCKSYPSDAGASLVELVRLWENTYGLQIKQLENRVTRESMGDFTGRLWLGQTNLAERLKIPEAAWNNASNPWFSNEEAITFQSSGPHEPSFAKFGGFLDLHPGAEAMRNKSIFVTILPDENNFFSVCPIISVQEGDFLGVFAGKIRYSGRCDATYGVPGPEGLWLDYSTVTGALNLMGVSRPGGDANVRLDWELINERKEGKPFLLWRVAVRALRAIKPFEEIVRTAPRKEQYLLHQSAACAERGFRKVRGSSTHALPDQQLQTDLEASLQPEV
ncbi:uncharacterized protein N7473_011182 [Penicillium subrubescens]|uniref:Uncharacterized protein n=1 Tax=Penicillium subrubescens TaxID=1316194 RepID=A0A1Q5U8Z9_9EURO|nr:uncharacterized protein N7473_011182 [Penicillium subrubescens]KAJ5882748.1 hypothetical protein N7473_011182 [Penicillium subrubescens]OKP08920.1 hypothetical protein PENSUB_5501 [Penicillium subrubescens]